MMSVPIFEGAEFLSNQIGIELYEALDKGPAQKRRKIKRRTTKGKSECEPSEVSHLMLNFLNCYFKKQGNEKEEQESKEEEAVEVSLDRLQNVEQKNAKDSKDNTVAPSSLSSPPHNASRMIII